jgi:hypothetical protein
MGGGAQKRGVIIVIAVGVLAAGVIAATFLLGGGEATPSQVMDQAYRAKSTRELEQIRGTAEAMLQVGGLGPEQEQKQREQIAMLSAILAERQADGEGP